MNTYRIWNGTMTLYTQSDSTQNAAKEFAKHDKGNAVTEVEVTTWDGKEWVSPKYQRIVNS